MAEREELSAVGSCDEAAEPSPGDVLQEDTLDRVLRTELEDLAPLGLDQLPGQARNCSDGSIRRPMRKL
jgi:hypothetical protein